MLTDLVTVVAGRVAFHFPNGHTVADLAGRNALAIAVGPASWCHYKKGSKILARVFTVIDQDTHEDKYPGKY